MFRFQNDCSSHQRKRIFLHQMKMNFEKMRDNFLHNMPIHNNLFPFSHRCYELGETKSVLQAMFHVFQRTISVIKFKELFQKMEFNFTKLRDVCIPNRPIVKSLLQFLHSYHRLGEFKRYS